MNDFEHSLRLAQIRTESYIAEAKLDILRLQRGLKLDKNPSTLLVKKTQIKIKTLELKIEDWELDLEEITEKISKVNPQQIY